MGKTLRQATFPRTPTGASFARRLIADALRGWTSEDERLDFVLAAGEAISSAVRHGGGETFAIRCWSNGRKIIVDVIDEGSGFASRPLQHLADDESDIYGMLIIHGLTDEVHLLNGGRRMSLVKRPAVSPAISFRVG